MSSGLGTPLAANAYLGAWGIVELPELGRRRRGHRPGHRRLGDVGPAAAHFGWKRTDYDALAGAIAAGHVIECGTQATGGNYAFFAETPRPAS